jgi:hypothetical protein
MSHGQPALEGAVQIAGLVADPVVAPVVGDPPQRSTLGRAAGQNRSHELHRPGGLEGVV